jgi:hypothetical protein
LNSYDNADKTWLNNAFAYVDANLHGGYCVYNWDIDSKEGLLSSWNGALRTYGNDVKNYYLSH